jgi:ABC-type nitrate/sulfonate/bicarbonate transport system substrate-binding protein
MILVNGLFAGRLLILATAVILSLWGRANAQTMQPLSLIVFPGGFNWPIWVAQEKGYFAKNGLEVRLTPTPGSVFQMTGLIEGKFDIAPTAFDNVVAYVEGQGEVPSATEPDLLVFMGGDNALLNLATVPEVKTYPDLKGKTVSVDAVTTGYAFVLFDLLERNGLGRGDYNVEKVGGVVERWNALREKKHDGTMLVTPFDLIAKANGFNILQRAIDLYGHYQGLVGAARRSWASKNRETLVGYIRGYRGALSWLFDPANKEEAIAILRGHLTQMTAEIAAQSYAALVNPQGFAPDAAVDIAGTRRVLELRSRFGEPKKTLTDPMKYFDPSYFEAATRQ